MQAGGRRFDSVHLHQFEHQTGHHVPAGFMRLSSGNSNLGRLALGARRSRFPGRSGRNWGPFRTVSRYQSRTLVLDAPSRCLSLWIGLLDEGAWPPGHRVPHRCAWRAVVLALVGSLMRMSYRFGVQGLSLRVTRGSSASRASGGCLGTKRRRRTWHAAISHGEL